MEDKIVELLERLAGTLGVAVEKLLEVLVRQEVINGISLLVWAALLLFIVVAAGLAAYKGHKAAMLMHKGANAREEYWDSAGSYVAFFGTIIALLFLIMAVFCGQEGVKHLLNPEYYALQNLLSMIPVP